jgi:hypothetical protein
LESRVGMLLVVLFLSSRTKVKLCIILSSETPTEP